MSNIIFDGEITRHDVCVLKFKDVNTNLVAFITVRGDSNAGKLKYLLHKDESVDAYLETIGINSKLAKLQLTPTSVQLVIDKL